MPENTIQQKISEIVADFGRKTSLAESKAMLGEAKDAVEQYFAQALQVDGKPLTDAAAAQPDAVHDATKSGFGFNIHQQPQYGEVDDYAWEFSQRFTTLEGVNLPSNAVFYTSERKEVPRAEVERKMDTGDFHLFDIALSNEYVLLEADEQFSVRDIENRFSTNNEHLPPQSQSKRDGSVKIFKSDPRAIVISYSETNGARGHLQVVFHDENGKPQSSVAMHRYPGEEESQITVQDLDAGSRGARYPISMDDAPYYAYALALTHFAGGFSAEADKYWFDEKQAQEVATMLGKIGDKGFDNQIEPVLRDVLADAKQLRGNINPVAVVPDVFASALQSEIDRGKFNGRTRAQATEHTDSPASFVQRLASQGQASGVGQSLH